jgi:photosystem II stability/assembly factor-like uncharacterized protein
MDGSERQKVMLFAGTRKGGLILSSDYSRKNWTQSEVQFKGWTVMNMAFDRRDQRLHAGAFSWVFGSTTHYSDDFGQTWIQAKQVPEFTRPSKSGRPFGTPEEAYSGDEYAEFVKAKPEKVNKVWQITPGRESEPGVLYAGIEPAALFVSRDRGETWENIESIYDHEHRGTWYPGGGGLCLHTIMLDPDDPERMYIGISSAGVYRTDDGGKTWQPKNRNVRADYHPDIYPEYGQCVHRTVLAPGRPGLIYQQNHCGVYRSDNYGDDWIDIGDGRLPSRFGFPVAVHPHDPNTTFISLEESDQYRLSVDGKFSVWRSKDCGESWDRLSNGLPDVAHLVVLRQGMTTDTLDEPGIYIGTSTGQIFSSVDEGNTWELLADYLPPILSLEAAVIG